MASIYLDYNARAPLSPQAKAAIEQATALCGNPSSPHRDGRLARALVEDARLAVAAFCGAHAENVVFTSSGTEANALAMRLSPQWLLSAVEHISVIANCPDYQAIPVDSNGVVELDRLDELLAQHPRAFVSVQLANNETGVIQPLASIAEKVKASGGFLHCDGVQAAGKMPLDIRALGVDALSLSAHKLGGSPGAGALVLAAPATFEPLLKGGGQEFGQRAGTENILALASFAAAAAAAAAALQKKDDKPLRAWRDELEQSLPIGSVVFGQSVARLDNTSCFALPGISAEKGLILFDLAGISLSAGAACSSGTLAASPTLLAQGVDRDLAKAALRASLGRESTLDDVHTLIKVAQEICATHNIKAA